MGCPHISTVADRYCIIRMGFLVSIDAHVDMILMNNYKDSGDYKLHYDQKSSGLRVGLFCVVAADYWFHSHVSEHFWFLYW
eukprot:c15235_g1_i2 orf=731-973(+)